MMPPSQLLSATLPEGGAGVGQENGSLPIITAYGVFRGRAEAKEKNKP